jgi:pyrroline-5-carboxylate reductase
VSAAASAVRLDGPLLLVGAGKMGGAMLERWIEAGLGERICVADPAPPPEIAALIARAGLRHAPDPDGLPEPAVALLAVKPQIMAQALPALARRVTARTLVVSILAGKTLAALEAALPPGTAVVRAMPNTPAAVGRGMTVAVANARVDAAQRDLADALLAATGRTAWIEDEGLMDAVTAVSGSGPAYVFLLAECLAAAGVEAGLPPALASELARATVAGAGELLHRSSEPAETLRRNVTSPGGTTAAALEVLMAPGALDALLARAVEAAAARSRELAG